MSEQSIGRLIEEAREYVPSESFIRDYGEELIVRLSDALEAAEQRAEAAERERDGIADALWDAGYRKVRNGK